MAAEGLGPWVAPIASYALALEVLYRAAQAGLSRMDAATLLARFPDANVARLRKMGPSYAVSTVHAVALAGLGCAHLADYANKSVAEQLVVAPLPPGASALEHLASAGNSACIFAAYLGVDLAHVLAAYPRLGGADVVAHHAAFLACALLSLRQRMLGLAFSWLIVGEASTPLLNARWLLRTLGRGDSALFGRVNLAFGAVFGATRVALYGAGLAWHLHTMHEKRAVLGWPLPVVTALVAAGYGLNLFWFSLIVRAGIKSGRRKQA